MIKSAYLIILSFTSFFMVIEELLSNINGIPKLLCMVIPSKRKPDTIPVITCTVKSISFCKTIKSIHYTGILSTTSGTVKDYFFFVEIHQDLSIIL